MNHQPIFETAVIEKRNRRNGSALHKKGVRPFYFPFIFPFNFPFELRDEKLEYCECAKALKYQRKLFFRAIFRAI
jgi:hypothetical protein